MSNVEIGPEWYDGVAGGGESCVLWKSGRLVRTSYAKAENTIGAYGEIVGGEAADGNCEGYDTGNDFVVMVCS